MTLSDKAICLKGNTIYHSENYFIEADVKEFIKELKEHFNNIDQKIIDKLAGDKLK